MVVDEGGASLIADKAAGRNDEVGDGVLRDLGCLWQVVLETADAICLTGVGLNRPEGLKLPAGGLVVTLLA